MVRWIGPVALWSLVGVTTLVQAGYYPTAGMYVFYAGFVVVGFVVWLRASRTVVDATDESRRAEVSA